MKTKHIEARIKQCIAISECSPCPRRKFGALLLDPQRNVLLMDGYNGGPRGGVGLCGGDHCLRTTQGIPSGIQYELGCHHAEMNVITNAAAQGVATDGAWLIVTGEPCILCAKLAHHAGIAKVICVAGGFIGGDAGPQYLRQHGVLVDYVDGPPDPRS